MPRRLKVVSVNRVNNCCPSYATKALHLASWPNRPRTVQCQTYYKWAIVNNRKRKLSRIHVLCNDVVLFRRGQKILVQSALGRVKTSSKETSKRRTERKKLVCWQPVFLSIFCHRERQRAVWRWSYREEPTRRRDKGGMAEWERRREAQSPWKKLWGTTNLQSSQKSQFLVVVTWRDRREGTSSLCDITCTKHIFVLKFK